MKIHIVYLAGLCLVLNGCGQPSSTDPLGQMGRSPASSMYQALTQPQKNVILQTTVEWQTPKSGPELFSERQYTPLRHFNGSTYFVWIDPSYRPWVTKVTNGTEETVPLDNNPDYTTVVDGHNRFSMGIDREGYLHITGDMHNYTEFTVANYVSRYQRQTILYWKSNKPKDVSSGFSFVGGKGTSTAIPGIGWAYGRFFTDNQGELYYNARVKAILGSHQSGEMGLGLYKYDLNTKKWIALGGLAEDTRPGSYNKVLLWENSGMDPGGWYQGFLASFKFDSENHLHFAATINTNSTLTGNDRLVYAVSKDGGLTWKRANGTRISHLPIRAVDGKPNQGDIVARAPSSPFLDSRTKVIADKNGRPAVSNNGIWYIWNGTAWVKQDKYLFATSGELDPDHNLILTSATPPKIFRADSLDDSILHGYDLSAYDHHESVDEHALRTTGALYGVGINRTTGVQSILKTSVTPAPLPCGWDNKDIAGSPLTFAGTAGFSKGTFVVTNYGVAIDDLNDSLHFVYKRMTGNGSITARVNSTLPSTHSRAGVMMRETLASDSRHVMSLHAPGRLAAIFGYRSAVGGKTTNSWMNGINGTHWVKLERQENVFTGFISKDGKTWTQTGKTTLTLPSTLYVGLAAASYNKSSMQEARFDSVSAPGSDLGGSCTGPSPLPSLSPPSSPTPRPSPSPTSSPTPRPSPSPTSSPTPRPSPSPSATCVKANPLVTMTPRVIQAAPGASVSYQIQVTNQQSNACPIALYNIYPTLPAGFTGKPNPALMWLKSGKSATASLQITSSAITGPGNYPLMVRAVRSGDSSSFGLAGTTLTIQSPPNACVRANPLVKMTPSEIRSTPGANVSYQLQVTSKDSSACTNAALFNIYPTLPAGFTGASNPVSFRIKAGESSSATLRVISPSNTASGRYPVQVKVVRSGVSSSFGSAQGTLRLFRR